MTPRSGEEPVWSPLEASFTCTALYVFGMLRDAARHTIKEEGSIQALVAATLQVEDERVLLDRWLPKGTDPTTDASQSVYIDVCGVRNPTTKARNVRYRLAASAGWQAAFVIVWDKTVVSRDQMRAVLNDAGVLVGIGDGRGVGYGRFTVGRFRGRRMPRKQTAA